MGDENKEFQPVTHVIFDMDGLLLDTEKTYEKIIKKIASKYGKEYTLDVRLKLIGRTQVDSAKVAVEEMKLPITIDEYLEQYHPLCREFLGNPDLMPDSEKIYKSVFNKFAEEFGKEFDHDLEMKILGRKEDDAAMIFCADLELPISVDEFLERYHPICERELTEPELLPGVDKLIRHLSKHNIPIAIATSGNEWLSKIKIQNYIDLFSAFHHTVYGSSDPEVVNGKPAPDIYLICAARFPDNPNPEKVLVFEDAPNGVEGAYAAGMQVVMIPAPEVDEELKKHATLVLTTMEDFVPESFGLPPYDNDE